VAEAFGGELISHEDLICSDLALEELRRTAVSASVQRAYRQGGNTANRERQFAARQRREQLLAPYAALLSRPSMSINSKARHVAKRVRGLSERTIRRYITTRLKEVGQAKYQENSTSDSIAPVTKTSAQVRHAPSSVHAVDSS
jgi:hypothetical protein